GTDPNNSSDHPYFIETDYQYLEDYLAGNATLILVVQALVSGNFQLIESLNSSFIGNMTEIQAVLLELGYTPDDTDYDGLSDLEELTLGTNPLSVDTDNDNLLDGFEIKIGTDPLDDDTDGDGYYDGIEVMLGSDPNNFDDIPSVDDTTTDPFNIADVFTNPTFLAVASGLLFLLIAIIAVARLISKKPKKSNIDDVKG
ncbi:MAG: thrombospondin type 3 repeat-containing protein, partial [Promethearchaeota archaeon]